MMMMMMVINKRLTALSFLPQSKNIPVRSTGDSKLSVGVNVRANGRLSLCDPVIKW